MKELALAQAGTHSNAGADVQHKTIHSLPYIKEIWYLPRPDPPRPNVRENLNVYGLQKINKQAHLML